MTNPILGSQIQEKFDSVKSLLARVIALAQNCDDQRAKETLKDRLKTLDSAALFVIVGEVNAGKSSFINALLSEEICEVAPDPCTSVIQELVYGSERQKIALGDHWERTFLDSPVLKSISIVDTPGTNSIFSNHQTITEQYIPQSDLVVFVFPAKNPYTHTAWELLTFIRKEWHRKTVFVLQQADLVDSQKELAIHIDRVKQYAHERNVQNPMVFSLSAKRERDGNSDSGFSEFRDYLRKTIENGDVWRIKMEGARETTRKVSGQLLEQLTQTRAGLAADKAFLESLRIKIDSRRDKAASLRRLTVDSLCLAYDRLADSLKQDFKNGLNVGTILRRSVPYVRDKNVKQWLTDLKSQFEEKAKTEIEAEASRVSKDLCNEVEDLFEELSRSIDSHKANIVETGFRATEDRGEIFDALKRKLYELKVADIVSNQVIGSSQIGEFALAGGGIAALGGAIAFATKLLILDITGGILASTGVLIVVATLLWKRKAILSEFDMKIDASRSEFRDKLNAEIERLFNKLFLELDHRLAAPLSEIDQQIEDLAPLVIEAEACRDAANTI